MEIPAQAATASFEAFFEESCQRIVGIVAVATGDVAAAEDAVQDAYARALTHWGRVSNYDRPDLWVARVATRLAIDAWRKRRRETALEFDMRASVHDDIDRLWVRWGLEGLSPMQRMTVILRHVEGRPVVEVAAAGLDLAGDGEDPPQARHPPAAPAARGQPAMSDLRDQVDEIGRRIWPDAPTAYRAMQARRRRWWLTFLQPRRPQLAMRWLPVLAAVATVAIFLAIAGAHPAQERTEGQGQHAVIPATPPTGSLDSRSTQLPLHGRGEPLAPTGRAVAGAPPAATSAPPPVEHSSAASPEHPPATGAQVATVTLTEAYFGRTITISPGRGSWSPCRARPTTSGPPRARSTPRWSRPPTADATPGAARTAPSPRCTRDTPG